MVLRRRRRTSYAPWVGLRSQMPEMTMRYGDEDRESENIEDRRGKGGPMFRFPGSGEGTRIQIPVGGGGVSLTTLVIIGVIMLFLGINPLDLLSGGQYP